MDSQPPSKPNPENTNFNQVKETTPENLPPSNLNLKLDVEKIYRDVDQLRKLLQTLVTGLILAIILSLGVSSWFAYRLLLQEQIFQQQIDDTTKKQAEIESNLENLKIQLQTQNQELQTQNQELQSLKQQLQTQNQELQSLKQQLPENLQKPEDLQKLLLNYQQQIQKLRERLEKLETE